MASSVWFGGRCCGAGLGGGAGMMSMGRLGSVGEFAAWIGTKQSEKSQGSKS